MSVPGGIQNNPQVSSRLAAQAQAQKADVKETAKGMKEVMTNIKELSQELRNQQSVKTSSKEQNSKLETQTNKALDQLKDQAQLQQKQVTQQSNSQQAQLGKGQDADVIAAAMAGLMAEEELGEESALEKSIEEKMEKLVEFADQLEDVELENSDDNFELQKMFKNAKKFKELKNRDQNLSKQIEDLEINIKQQEAQEKLNEVAAKDATKKMRDEIMIRHSEAEKQEKESHQQSNQEQNREKDEEETDEKEDLHSEGE